MVTHSENTHLQAMEAQGYHWVHSGSPDFLFYRVKDVPNPTLDDIDLESIEFHEVKTPRDTLSHEQQIWRHILEKLGVKYRLVVINPPVPKAS